MNRISHLTATPQATAPASASEDQKASARLEQSVEYFYPIKDREQMVNSKNRLGVKLAELSSLKDKFADANQVKAELVRLKK